MGRSLARRRLPSRSAVRTEHRGLVIDAVERDGAVDHIIATTHGRYRVREVLYTPSGERYLLFKGLPDGDDPRLPDPVQTATAYNLTDLLEGTGDRRCSRSDCFHVAAARDLAELGLLGSTAQPLDVSRAEAAFIEARSAAGSDPVRIVTAFGLSDERVTALHLPSWDGERGVLMRTPRDTGECTYCQGWFENGPPPARVRPACLHTDMGRALDTTASLCGWLSDELAAGRASTSYTGAPTRRAAPKHPAGPLSSDVWRVSAGASGALFEIAISAAFPASRLEITWPWDFMGVLVSATLRHEGACVGCAALGLPDCPERRLRDHLRAMADALD